METIDMSFEQKKCDSSNRSAGTVIIEGFIVSRWTDPWYQVHRWRNIP